MSDYVIAGRKPERIFRFFEELNGIPRGSYHEKEISDFLVSFAKARGLEVYQDGVYNVLIRMPATAGWESKPPILLQGHLDMVCEKNADVVHDFEKDGIKMYVDGKYLRAKGTTLGGDNGIAVAIMMALLDGEIAEHPAYECLFTTSEEMGLDGARAFDYTKIRAKRMINLDSESEDQVTVGCAGGVRTEMVFPLKEVSFRGKAIRVTIKGLAGGHSGENINSGRANANKLMGRILASAPEFRLISLFGGSKDNAIPRECVAELAVPSYLEKAVSEDFLPHMQEVLRGELCEEDAAFALSCEPIPSPEKMCDRKTTLNIVSVLASVSNGVLAMSSKIPGLVEFSRSLGVISTKDHTVTFVFSARSALESQLDASEAELEALGALAEAEVTHHSRYPGWNFSGKSPLRDLWLSACRKVLGTEPSVTVIHAGLECGIISSHLPELDIISVGPNMQNIHSPDEALDLESCERIWKVLQEVITA